jgi:hypothetical protein
MGALSTGVKQQKLETDGSPSYTVADNNGGSVSMLPHTSSLNGAKFIKLRDKFILLLCFTDEKFQMGIATLKKLTILRRVF